MNNYQNRVLECALEYIKLGWKVLPLHTIRDGQCACGKANCSSPGKHPITPNGVKDASGDEASQPPRPPQPPPKTPRPA